MTTPTLEAVLRDLAARGEITHISLTPSQAGKEWRASFAMSSMFGVSFAEDDDPARAIILACTTATGLKRKPRAVTINLKATEVVPEPVDASDTNDADGPASGNPTEPPASTVDPLGDLM